MTDQSESAMERLILYPDWIDRELALLSTPIGALAGMAMGYYWFPDELAVYAMIVMTPFAMLMMYPMLHFMTGRQWSDPNAE